MLLTVVPAASHAANLDYVYLRLSRNMTNLSNGVALELVINPSTLLAASDNQIVIRMPNDGDGEWCRNAGALTVGPLGSWGDFSHSVTSIDSGAAAECVKGTDSGTFDYIRITGLGDMSADGYYGLTLSGDTGLLGTINATGSYMYTVCTDDQSASMMDAQCGTAVDSKTGSFAIIENDQVNVSVSAMVLQNFVFSIDANSCSLGELVAGSRLGSCALTLTTNMNGDGSGYVTTVVNTAAGLTDGGSNDIDAVSADATIYNFNEQYGISSEVGENSDEHVVSDFNGTITGAADTPCVDGNPGQLSAFDALSTEPQSVVTSSTTSSAESTKVCIAAAASSSTAEGVYSDTLTFVSTGRY